MHAPGSHSPHFGHNRGAVTTMRLLLPAALLLAALPLGEVAAADPTLRLNEKGYFETRVNAAIQLVAERP